MNFGTWNIQGARGKMEEIERELTIMKMDIITLTETKKKGIGTEMINNYVHIYSGVSKHDRAKRGVSILINKKHKNKITNWNAYNENIVTVNMNIRGNKITVLGVYGISNDEPVDKKTEFFQELEQCILEIGNNREIVLLGDLNGRTGRKMNNRIVGPWGEDTLNDNGNRLIDFCETYDLRITNGFYKHKEIHKFTRVQPTLQQKSIIDYLVTKQKSNIRINDVRVWRGAICGSDHYLLKAETNIPYAKLKPGINKEGTEDMQSMHTTRLNILGLGQESTRFLYKKRLDQKLILGHTTLETYNNIVTSIREAAKEALGEEEKRKSKKLWWTPEIEELVMEKKRAYLKWINTHDRRDKEIYNEKKRETRNLINFHKNELWDKKCEEVNTYIGGTRSNQAWGFIKAIRSEKSIKTPLQVISTKKWKAHYQQLLTEDRHIFSAPSPKKVSVQGERVEITIDMVKKVVKELRNNKAPGPEEINAELVKNGTEKLFSMLARVFTEYVNGHELPESWKEMYISSIHKNGDKSDCGNYRGISVTSTMSKIFGRILRQLIEKEYGSFSEEQSGFRAGRSCNDNVFCLKQIVEKKTCRKRETHLLFVDLSKAYDNVPLQKLWQVLEESPINVTIIRTIQRLYEGSNGRIKIGDKISSSFPITKGLRQGCCLSPTLFNIYIDRVLREWKRKCKGMGIPLNDKITLYTLQFADDQVIVAHDREDLEYMARKLLEEYEEWGMSINLKKTKYLCVGEAGRDLDLGQNGKVEACTEYRYLGVIFDETGKDEREVRERIIGAKKIIGSINGVLWSKRINKQRKKTLYNTLIKNTMLYGCETWRLTQAQERKIAAVEMDAIRRALMVSRMDRIRNDTLKEEMGMDSDILQEITSRQLIWYGHVQRMQEDRLPKVALNWVPAERLKRGRPQKRWEQGIRNAMSERNLQAGQWDDRDSWSKGIGQRRRTF